MIRKFALAAVAAFAFAAPALAGDMIEGTWLRPSTGTLVKWSASGGGYCGTVLSGEHKGKSIGCLKGSNGSYKGTVIAVDEGKSYNGKASVNGNSMNLKGCVAGGLICKGETWSRQ